LVAALWLRVEYQMKLLAPWANMAKGSTTSQRTIQLDYISMIKVFAIWPAFKNKNYNVAFASIVAISLQISIILSTGLFTLLPTKVQSKSVPISVQSHFVDSIDGIKGNSQLPALLAVGHQTSHLPYPLGLSDEVAYQVPGTDIPPGTTETLMVESFSTSLYCEHVGNDQFVNIGNASYSVNSRFWPSCTITVFLSQTLESTEICLEHDVNFISSLIPASCSKSDSPNDQRIVAIWGNTVCPVPDPKNISFKQVAVLLCLPKYAIRQVEVAYTAGQEETVKINQIPGATERQLSTAHPWDIAQAQFDLYTWSSHPWVFETKAVSEAIAMQLQANAPMATALGLYTNDTIPYSELLLAENLEQMIQQYYTRIGAAIGHVALTRSSNDMVNGSTWVNEQRLLANSLPVQFIVGLLVLSLVMTVSLIALTPREKVLLLDNPGSVIGIATHIYRSKQLLVGLRGQGSSSDKSLKEHTKNWKIRTSTSDSSPQLVFHVEDGVPRKWQTRKLDQWTWLQPLIIRPVSRILICLLMVILILTLELLLRESESHNGLAVISNIDSLHYLWTLLPSSVMVLVGLLVGAVEFAVICHNPFWNLKSKMAIKLLDSNFLDNTRPALIVQAIQTRSVVIVLASIAVVFSSFLNIFTASLFVPRITTADTAGSLKILETFMPALTGDLNTEIGSTMDLAAPLILTQNLSFPAMSTEALIIPKIELVEQVDMKNASITARLPALHTSMECTAYQAGEMKLQSGLSKFDDSLIANITFPRTETCRNLESSNKTVKFSAYLQSENLLGSLRNDTIIGASAGAFQLIDNGLPTDCESDFYFAYGLYRGSWELSRIQGLACKFTPKLVMANVTLTGPELRLDVQNISYDADAISGPINYLKPYYFFNEYSFQLPVSLDPTSVNDSNLDGFFQLLTSGSLSISVPDLADPGRSDHVAAAIHRQLTVIQTQNNQHSRHSLDSTKDIVGLIDRVSELIGEGLVSPSFLGQNTTQLTADILNVHDIITKLNPTRGTITNSYQIRLVQDVASTRLLQGLLGVMLVCIGIVSLLIPTKAVLPREPTSIASVSALLVDGNLLEHLPVNAQSEKPRDYWWSWGRGLDFQLEWREDNTHSSLEVSEHGDAETNESSEIGLDEYLVIEEEEPHSVMASTSQNITLTACDKNQVDILKFGIFVSDGLNLQYTAG
jgi:hypothetical protein